MTPSELPPPVATVALVGATGRLGGLIADALLEHPDVAVRCLVRPRAAVDASASPSDAPRLRHSRVTVVEGDLSAGGEAALTRLCAGADVVVSAVQGGPDVVVDGQRRLLAAAREAGARRLIPSDFSIDFAGLGAGENVALDWRRAFAEAADAERGEVEVVHVFNGCFTDRPVLFGFLGALDTAAGVAHLWGEGRAPMAFTTYADAAAYTAAAALAPGPLPPRLSVAGDVLDVHQLVAAYAAASGRPMRVERHGTLADLDATIAARQAAAPAELYAYLPLMYWRAMLGGRAAPGPLDNARFPEVHPTDVRAYVAREWASA